MKLKLYIESTVPGYLTSRPSRDIIKAARQQITRDWWSTKLSKYDPFISELVLKEISDGDAEASKLRIKAVKNFPLLEVTSDIDNLTMAYFKAIKLPETAMADAVHLALSAWHGMDYLLTWNFKHIANVTIRKSIDLVSAKFGIVSPIICTPEDLLEV